MLISVIVPVYNVDKYLRECLDSLIVQTYKKLEIIVIDDGSTDCSGKICDEYAAKYNYIKVIHKENAGLGMARNTGLEHMTGEYVTFVDSDDYLEPDCIENLYIGLTENKVDMCKGGFQRFTGKNKVLYTIRYNDEFFEKGEARTELLPRMIGSRPDRQDSIEMCVCGALYAVAPIKEHSLRFPSERELISEDLVFNIDYMQYANGACTISDVGYKYRMNPGSLSTQYRSERFQQSCYFFLKMKKHLLDLKYDEITILRLHRVFFVYIRVCIKQETRKISKLSSKESIKNIRRICSDEVVINAIKAYPVRQLGFKQFCFLIFIKNKWAFLLYILAELKIF